MIQLLADTLSSSQSGGPKKAPSTSQSRISTKSPVHEVETGKETEAEVGSSIQEKAAVTQKNALGENVEDMLCAGLGSGGEVEVQGIASSYLETGVDRRKWTSHE